jgi:hypothetical protein
MLGVIRGSWKVARMAPSTAPPPSGASPLPFLIPEEQRRLQLAVETVGDQHYTQLSPEAIDALDWAARILGGRLDDVAPFDPRWRDSRGRALKALLGAPELTQTEIGTVRRTLVLLERSLGQDAQRGLLPRDERCLTAIETLFLESDYFPLRIGDRIDVTQDDVVLACIRMHGRAAVVEQVGEGKAAAGQRDRVARWLGQRIAAAKGGSHG